MKKALFFIALGALFVGTNGVAAEPPAASGRSAPLPRVFMLDGENLRSLREGVNSGKVKEPALDDLRKRADAGLKLGSLSVMQKSIVPPSGDKHDYMSLAPYFWPDPTSPTGLPYINRDGERNPEVARVEDRANFGRLVTATYDLALAYYLFGNEEYAGKATALLKAWFLDPVTRMNPNLNFGQAVRGRNDGRSFGLIETRDMAQVVDAVGLLAGSKSWTEADQSGMQDWFTRYLEWLQQSSLGKGEAAAKNNHGTFYDVQVVSVALFLGNADLARHVLTEATAKRIGSQIEPDGSQPLELARTKSFSYSVFNLSALFELARLGENAGVDLWNAQTKDGRSIRKALDYMVPFATGERKWAYKQIESIKPEDLAQILSIASSKYGSVQYLDIARKLDPSVLNNLNSLLAGSKPR